MESGDEDDAFTMGEREWQKMNRDLSKQGYREGKSDGRDKSRQEAFEQAVNAGFQHSLKLGQVIGFIEWKLSQTSKPANKEKLKKIREDVMVQLTNLKQCTDSPATEDIPKNLQKICEDLLSLAKSPEEANLIKNFS